MIKATGAQIITGILERQGISIVSGIPGGMILPLYDELTRSGIVHGLARHELGAGFIAQGLARSTGKTSVCIATSGPGAMNLLTALADARSDSVPLVAITGQVNRGLIGTDAFQETDTFGLSMPITKHSVMVTSAEELLSALPAAFEIAASGRPGPVLVDVPRDVQTETAEFERWPDPVFPSPAPFPGETAVAEAAHLADSARRPVLFCGGGVTASGAGDSVVRLMEKCGIPAVVSLMGIGSVASDHPLYAGMVGMHGSYCANRLVHDSDVIIAVGVRFDDRATGAVAKFCPGAKIIHIDVDAAEINKIYRSEIALEGDAARIIPALTSLCAAQERPEWTALLKEYRKTIPAGYGDSPSHPSALVARIAVCAQAEDGVFVTTDVGQHQMWAAQSWPVSFPRQFITSGSLGTMGFGLPAAIGVALANPGRRVICLSGDGSIMMNIQELATLAELGLDVTVIVFDNGCLGMVRQQQELLFGGNYSASVYGKSPCLTAVAEGFGIPAYDTAPDTFGAVISESVSRHGPCFVRVPVPQDCNVYPFVPAGKANIEAEGLS